MAAGDPSRRRLVSTSAKPRLKPMKRHALETGIPYTTLRDIAARGELPVVHVGRALYIEQADMDRWIDAHKEGVA